jgi:hypothetical protein
VYRPPFSYSVLFFVYKRGDFGVIRAVCAWNWYSFTQMAAVYLSVSVFDSLSFPVRKRNLQNSFFQWEKISFSFF